MATLTLRFVTDSSIVSTLIRKKTWCDYSHVDLILDDGTALGARTSGGVAIRPYNYAKFSAIALFTVDLTTEQKFLIEGFAKAQVGKAYDYGSIAGILFHRDWRNTDKWNCGELIAAAFEQARPLLNISPDVDRIVPRDLLLSVLLKRIPSAV